jgi:hypothetical protein
MRSASLQTSRQVPVSSSLSATGGQPGSPRLSVGQPRRRDDFDAELESWFEAQLGAM